MWLTPKKMYIGLQPESSLITTLSPECWWNKKDPYNKWLLYLQCICCIWWNGIYAALDIFGEGPRSQRFRMQSYTAPGRRRLWTLNSVGLVSELTCTGLSCQKHLLMAMENPLRISKEGSRMEILMLVVSYIRQPTYNMRSLMTNKGKFFSHVV